MSAVETKERTFDPLGLYDEILFMPGDVDGFDRKGNPLNAKGKILAVRESERYRLQNGSIFDAGGQLVEDPPKRVREQVEKMKADHPRFGITHAARMRKCPVPNCPFRTPREEFYRGHRRLHMEVSDEEWARLEGGAGPQRPMFSLGDSANPSEFMQQFTGGAGGTAPETESAQGEG